MLSNGSKAQEFWHRTSEAQRKKEQAHFLHIEREQVWHSTTEREMPIERNWTVSFFISILVSELMSLYLASNTQASPSIALICRESWVWGVSIVSSFKLAFPHSRVQKYLKTIWQASVYKINLAFTICFYIAHKVNIVFTFLQLREKHLQINIYRNVETTEIHTQWCKYCFADSTAGCFHTRKAQGSWTGEATLPLSFSLAMPPETSHHSILFLITSAN